ncbi:MAG TPA: helix-turn-helix domain-containing protein [Vicinamibacterales bacterium]|nr:helix-turn-helix domain-containing protein [Vicinamibacterales bacterium]
MKRKPRPNGKYISLKDAEAIFGLSYDRLRRLVLEGKVPRLSSAAVGQSFMVLRADLEAFLKQETR